MINELGLIYTFKGSEKGLQHILFAAHQNVVPPGPLDRWTHPPFNPYFDRKWLWGHGSSDCKNNLIGLLSVVENLLEQNWHPKRTILLAFNYDEEIRGVRGGSAMAEEPEKRYGSNGIAMIMNEGGMGIDVWSGYAYALPAVAEKAVFNAHLKLEVDGGHSSRPSPRSGIGIMADMIVALEKNPFEPRLTTANPFRGLLECQVHYSPREVEGWLKDALIHGENRNEATIGNKLANSRAAVRFLLQTSQAVDIIKSGEKTNKLPGDVLAVVNYRIAPHDSIASVKKSITEVLTPLAKKYNVSIQGFGSLEAAPKGVPTLYLNSTGDLPPSPISPTGPDFKVWNVFSGTLRQAFEDVLTLKGKIVVPAGTMMTGNTDTKHHWNVSENIYRFTPARSGTRLGIHAIDERVDISSHIEGMRVYFFDEEFR